MTDLSNRWFLDGIDLFTAFGVFIEEGSTDFLRYPPKKQSIEHDWQDSNGREVDLSRVFFDQREIVLDMAIVCTDATDFFEKQKLLISNFTQPGIRRLTIASHQERSYYVYYKECNNYKAVKALTGVDAGLFAHRFSMVIVEPEPQIDNSHIFIIDHDGNFLIA